MEDEQKKLKQTNKKWKMNKKIKTTKKEIEDMNNLQFLFGL